jgi:hypothetical protein
MEHQNTEIVENFLVEFKVKLHIWNIVFLSDRQKNTQTMADLEMSVDQVITIIEKLELQDYSEGPRPDAMLNGADMWVFGKEVKGHEIYIKVTLGRLNSPVICISFHFAEYAMTYPFKNQS